MSDDLNKLIYEGIKDMKRDLRDHRAESTERHNIFVEKADKRFGDVEADVKDLTSFQNKSKGVLNMANFIGIGGFATAIGAMFLHWKG